MRNLEDTLVVTAGLVMGTALGMFTAALGVTLIGLPWELHFSTNHIAAAAVALAGITVVAQGVVIVVDLLAGSSPSRRGPARAGLEKENDMGAQRMLSWLIVLFGLALAVTPWLLSFARDHVARAHVVIGGVIVALLGVALIYAAPPEPARRLSH